MQIFFLIHEIIKYRLPTLFNLGSEGFEFIFKCISWGINHHQANIGDKVLDCALTLYDQLALDNNILSSFAQN